MSTSTYLHKFILNAERLIRSYLIVVSLIWMKDLFRQRLLYESVIKIPHCIGNSRVSSIPEELEKFGKSTIWTTKYQIDITQIEESRRWVGGCWSCIVKHPVYILYMHRILLLIICMELITRRNPFQHSRRVICKTDPQYIVMLLNVHPIKNTTVYGKNGIPLWMSGQNC